MDLLYNEEMINIYSNNNNKESFLDLAKYVAKRECNFNEIELDLINKFWDSTFNEKWFYVSREMLTEDFGYKDSNDVFSNFYKQILLKEDNFKINIDYKEVNEEYILNNYCLLNLTSNNLSTKGGLNRKYYIISGECYKAILMLTKTKKGKQIRDYYIKIEKLSIKTYKVISEIKNKLDQDKLHQEFNEKMKITEIKLNQEKSKNIKLSKFIESTKDLEKNEIIYIACNKALASENRFKVGGVKTETLLNNRLATYNSGLPNDDLMYYAFTIKVNKYSIIEDILKNLISNFLDKKDSSKEIYFIYYDDLEKLIEFICENIDKDIEYIKANSKIFIDNVTNKTKIPKNKFKDYDSICINKSGKTTKIDISNYTQEEIDNLILELTERYIKDNNINENTVKWNEYAKYLESKSTIKRSIIKKNISSLLKILNLKVKFK